MYDAQEIISDLLAARQYLETQRQRKAMTLKAAEENVRKRRKHLLDDVRVIARRADDVIAE